jgi:hypothetical protein
LRSTEPNELRGAGARREHVERAEKRAQPVGRMRALVGADVDHNL